MQSHGALMSRAFVKENDETVEELPDRPVSPYPNLVTAEGLAAIEVQLARLQQEHARASGDRAALAAISRELRYWTSRTASAQLAATPSSPTKVRFGCTVTIVRADDCRQTYRIVGEDEADPSRLMGKQVGDIVQVGNSEVELASIA